MPLDLRSSRAARSFKVKASSPTRPGAAVMTRGVFATWLRAGEPLGQPFYALWISEQRRWVGVIRARSFAPRSGASSRANDE